MDITNQVIQAIDGWLQSLAAQILQPALRAAGQLLFQTPAFDRIPEVQRSWGLVRSITDAVMVLAVLAGGLMVMASGTFETGYTVKRIGPRLIVAGILANSSLAICGALIQLDNALVDGLLGGPGGSTTWAEMTAGLSSTGFSGQLITSLVAIAAAVLGLLLVIVVLARDLILLLATVLAPLALVTYCLPQLDEIAQLWWRVYVALLFVQALQAMLIAIGAQLLSHSRWLGGAASELVSGLLLVTLLYLLLKLPFAAYHWAFRQSVGQNRVVRGVVGAARTVAAAV